LKNKKYNSPLYWIAASYLLLLLFSYLLQFSFPVQETDNKYQRTVTIEHEGRDIELNYLQLENVLSEKMIIILPDIYRSGQDLLPLAEKLSSSANVIIPFYPEADIEGRLLPASITSRSNLINTFLSTFGPDKIHLSGFGYGGLVMANLIHEHTPETIEGVIFLNSMGVQEMNFLGNYQINRSLYSLLSPITAIYKYGVPHFGYYNLQRLNSNFARSLRQMDQRNMEQWLRSIDSPVLVLHSEIDRYIPFQTSKEISRLIPQSELKLTGESYQSIKEFPEVWSAPVLDFISVVETGDYITRDAAPLNKIINSQKSLEPGDVESVAGWALIILLVIIFISALINEDITCISAGLLVATGILDYKFAVLTCFVGILTADVSTYWFGRWVGKDLLNWVPFKWIIKKRDIEWAENMFEMKGAGIIFATRVLPGTRIATYFTAGVLKRNFGVFLIYFVAAISLWTPFFVGISSLIGQPMLTYLEVYQDYALYIILLFILLIYSTLKFVLPLTTVKGRREFYVKWVRLTDKLEGKFSKK
jgi:membrane protein DedA with SNARE-associated domain